jgi:two-component system chemotaxis response regulator CheY
VPKLEPPLGGGSMAKILIVDDSATMRKIIMKGLEHAGFGHCEFIEAGDGVAALESFSKEEVSLILSDINMPKMNGIEFVRSLRGQATTQMVDVRDMQMVKEVSNTVPIVMVTTESSLEKAQEAISAGANDYLKKPFTPEQLGEKIRPYLD